MGGGVIIPPIETERDYAECWRTLLMTGYQSFLDTSLSQIYVLLDHYPPEPDPDP